MRARAAEAGVGVPAVRLSRERETPQLAAESAELTRLLASSVERSSAMAWICGPDALITFVNQPWLAFRGSTLEQECGTGWLAGVHPDDFERCYTEYLHAFESRQPFRLEFRLQRAEGSYAWLALNGVPQYLLNGTFLGYAGSGRLIKRKSSSPGHSAKTVTQRNVADDTEKRGQLLQHAFLHDLLNAAAGLEMVGDLLEESTLPEEPTEYVRLLQAAIKRLLATIYQQRVFLDDAGLPPAECPAREVLGEVIASLQALALRRNCGIELAPDSTEFVTVLGDKAQIVRILESMLRSAVEACAGGNAVTAGYRWTKGQVEFWVRAKISQQSFSTKKNATETGSQGVKLLSELYLKGSVAVSSSKEHGTTFSVRFPAAPKHL